MKILLDLLPLLAFFIAYSLPGAREEAIFRATAAAVVAGLAVAAWTWWRHRRVERLQIATTALLVVLGGLTLALHNQHFIMWKPTAVYWLFALAFVTSDRIGEKNLIRHALDAHVALSARAWRQLNLSWAAFFLILGAANLFVAYHFDETTWVRFKVFGMTALVLLFAIAQTFAIARHVKAPADEE